jgi:hypothetical protein
MSEQQTALAPRARLAACCLPLGSRPAALAPTRRWHAAADRFLIATRVWLIPAALALGVGAGQVANQLPSRYAMLPAVVYFLILGGWCSLNFARCREAHCLITGVGFDALTIAALVAVIIDGHWYNLLSLLILPLLIAGFAFEVVWTRRHGENAVRSRRNPANQI